MFHANWNRDGVWRFLGDGWTDEQHARIDQLLQKVADENWMHRQGLVFYADMTDGGYKARIALTCVPWDYFPPEGTVVTPVMHIG